MDQIQNYPRIMFPDTENLDNCVGGHIEKAKIS